MSCLRQFFIFPNFWTKNNSAVLRSKLIKTSNIKSATAPSLQSECYSTASEHLTEQKTTASLIVENTVKHQSLMVPELSLYLITPSTSLWKAPYDEGKTFGSDPFW